MLQSLASCALNRSDSTRLPILQIKIEIRHCCTFMVTCCASKLPVSVSIVVLARQGVALNLRTFAQNLVFAEYPHMGGGGKRGIGFWKKPY